MRERERHTGQMTLDQGAKRDFVRRIDDRPQQTDGDRLCPQRRDLSKNFDRADFIERRVHRTVAKDSLGNLQCQRLRHEWRRIGHREVKGVLPAAFPKDQRVRMARRRKEGGSRGLTRLRSR